MKGIWYSKYITSMKHLSPRTIILLILLVLMVIAIPVGVSLVSQSQDIRQKAWNTNNQGRWDIALQPSSTTLTAGGDAVPVTLTMDTKEEKISGLIIVMHVKSPDVSVSGLEMLAPFNGGGWSCGTNSITPYTETTQSVKVKMECFYMNAGGFSTTGLGVVTAGRFMVQANANAASTSFDIAFDTDHEKVSIISSDTGINDYANKPTDVSMTITGGTEASPSPSPSPSEQPTASPSPSSSASPTASPSPSPTNQTSASPTPTSTPRSGTSDSSSTTSTGGIGGSSTSSLPTSLSVTTIKESQTITTSLPKISGKAPANATITVTLQSEVQTATVKADAYGNWSYTPKQPLEVGAHTLTVKSTTTAGATETKTVKFSVTTPVTGNTSTTLAFLASGMMLVMLGIFFQLRKAELPNE